MTPEPQSLLTRERPDLWQRALTIATRTTGMLYLPKLTEADGSVSMCGGGYDGNTYPPRPSAPYDPSPARDHEWRWEDDGRGYAWRPKKDPEPGAGKDEEPAEKLLGVLVPEGAMEWLLHEVGHWVAATERERRLPDYGYGQEERGVGKLREWQAWAFEDAVLSPFGNARLFAPPAHRGGVAFRKAGPIAVEHGFYIDRRIAAAGVDTCEWRALYGEWIRHEQRKAVPSWQAIQ